MVRGWNETRGGRTDSLVLDDRIEVRFTPHRAEAIPTALREEGGSKRRECGKDGGCTSTPSPTRLPALRSRRASPRRAAGEKPLGHTARFVVDHVLCDVVMLSL